MSARARGKTRRLRGYGPLLGAVGAFLVMIAVVPSRAPDTASGASPAPGPVAQNEVATGGDTVKPCTDGRPSQVAGDPYAPPCFAFTGPDNGGETSRGVTAETITVSYRNSADVAAIASSVQSTLPSGVSAPDLSVASSTRTLEGLAEYFNKNFQFYGRKIKLVPFDASSNPMTELMGAGQQQAEVDAVTVDREIGAFADVSGTPTQPYTSALASKKVISLGAPSPSDEYFLGRRPYVWSFMPSCTTTTKASSEMVAKGLAGRPARWAGDRALQAKTRKIAVISPEGQEYQNCAAAGLAVLRAAGADAQVLSYKLDFGNMAKAAEELVNRMLVDGITTVALAGDPLLPMDLTKAATKVGFQPEWVIMGNALSDSDLLSQLYDQAQWSHAFGISVMGKPVPATASPAVATFKSMRPNEEPAPTVDGVYQQLYLLAIGIQMAGPQLTPESFERGMFAYPEHTGPGGSWRFEPGKYTPQTSVSVLWWDATKPSSNGAKGTFRYAGEAFRIGEAPTGEPNVFQP